MDLIPINVLADSKLAPSSPHAAPAKQSFANVLSSHPQPPDDRPVSQTKPDQSHSPVENKNLDRRATSAVARKSDQDQHDTDQKDITNPGATTPAPAPTPAPTLPVNPLAALLSLVDPAATKDSIATTEVSEAKATTSSVVLETPGVADGVKPTVKQVQPAATKPSSLTASAHSRLPGATHTDRAPEINAAVVDDIVPADSDTADSTPTTADHQRATEPKVQTDEVRALISSVMPDAVAKVATTPVRADLAHAQTAPPEKESTTNASAGAENANPDQPMIALAAAVEKVGAAVSTTVHAVSTPVAARPLISALKTAVAPLTGDNPTLAQGNNVSPARSADLGHRHSDAQTQDAAPGQLNQSAPADTSTPADTTPNDLPSAAAPGKENVGSTLSPAGSQAAATSQKNGMSSSPAGSTTTASMPQQEAATLAMNRANIVAGMELSGLSKTSLIERFRQSELHFGMQSGEFGHIEVRTLLDHHEVTARISVERGDLSRALESELPGLQKRLGDLDLPTARITLHEQSSAMSGDSGRRSKEQEWQSWQQQPAASTMEPHPAMTPLLEQAMAPEGLSIRI